MLWFRRYSTLMLPVALMFLVNSCAGYKMVDRSMENALENHMEKYQIHWGDVDFELYEPLADDEILEGLLYKPGTTPYSKSEVIEVPVDTKHQNLTYEENAGTDEVGSTIVKVSSVHITVSPDFPLDKEFETTGSRMVAIPFSKISQVQVQEIDVASTVARSFGVAILMLGVMAAIVAATKDSCPFIYVQDGDELILVGEIYSGAIHPPLERHDYLPLPVNGDGLCSLKITNEVFEIQHTNLTELMVFDHSPGHKVLVDRHGQALSIVNPESPLSLVKKSENGMDGMIFQFNRPAQAENMKLVLKGQNTPWMDHVLGILFERMGFMFKPWQEAQKSGSSEAMKQWSLDQGLPLKVSLKTADGWQYVDYFDLPGPIAPRQMAMDIDLANCEDNQVTLKLECGYRFWEIENVMADFSGVESPQATVVPLQNAVTGAGADVTANLLGVDSLYLHQPHVGDEAALSFVLPDLEKGMSRSVILHSKGHYDILRNPQGQPDVAFVGSFRKPGRVTEFSRALSQGLSNQGGN